MRATLDGLYKLSGLAAGFFLIAIAALSFMQIVGRLLGYAVHSFDEFAGYCMAASMFLGLAWTLRCNEHIRVTLVISLLRGRARRVAEIVCLAVATGIVGFFTWAALDMTWTSFKLGEPSQGLIPIPLWIPQTGMALGLTILLVAFVDDLLAALAGRPASYEAVPPSVDTSPVFER